jgi:EAL domain-containing protein (putative c-di-GMP-specific phosphodiesterase class I)
MSHLGHGLGLVADGVETEDRLAALRDIGCDYAQRFLSSPPVAAEMAQRTLALGRPLPA